ncbi:MAG: GDSL-type esterase/lipase family protein [Leptolyngbyaceae cyanobacterium bins.302]|nr:GDSL-type esterase/lipase family protein [Leptolyngbyaceae cyanobacterium bins.302]
MVLRIMPVGDSNTHGYITDFDSESGGYRGYLWNSLVADGLAVDFVGTRSNGPSTIDRNHEGYYGYRIDQVAGIVNNLLDTNQPDVILLMLGTNDLIQDTDVSNAPNRLAALIDQIFSQRPNVQILLASLPPLTYSDNDPQQVVAFNSAVSGIVTSRAAQGRRINFVDIYNSLTANDLADRIHPTATGYAQIANTWYGAIRSSVSFDFVSFNASNFSANENAPSTAAVTLTRSGRISEEVSGTIILSDGTATAPADYDNTPLNFSFLSGQTTITIPIPIVNDTLAEASETITLTLTNLSSGFRVVSPSTATFTILNNDVLNPTDFTGDGRADILWRNQVNGQNSLWQMNGSTLEQTYALPTVADLNWSVVGVADFTGDGRADILWRNQADGQNSLWQMNGTTLEQTYALPTVTDLNWSVVGVADFTGDGRADIFWRNATNGQNAITQINGSAWEWQLLSSPVEPSWYIVG